MSTLNVHTVKAMENPPQIHRKLGKPNELLKQFSGDYDAVMAWARSGTEKSTMKYNAKTTRVTVSLSRSAYIPKNEKRCFQIGYLFLQNCVLN